MTGVGGLVGMPLVYVTCMIEGLPTDDAVADRMVMVMMLVDARGGRAGWHHEPHYDSTTHVAALMTRPACWSLGHVRATGYP